MQEKSIFNAGKVVNSYYLPVSWWNCFAVKYTEENGRYYFQGVYIQCGKEVKSFYQPDSMLE